MIADIYQSDLHHQQQIKQALLYPAILCTTAILMTLCLLIFIVPRFAILFEDHQAQLPMLTRSIFYIAKIIHDHYLLVLFPFIYIACLFLPTSHAAQYRLSIQQSLAALPYLARLQKKMNLARFCSQLSLLYQAGIPLTEAIHLMINTTVANNHRQALQQLRQQLLAGKNLYTATQTASYFSPPLPDMIQVGELSGNLDTMLKHTALLYEGEIERTLKQISQLLEPLIMIILGVLIGGLVIGMYLPIFKLGSII
jgi:type IV pilus assembly protein PilC